MNFKRLSLIGGHVARGMARVVGLTPARIDFLVALYARPLCQRELATQLCVHDSVISRMVRVLMERGLVQREIPVADQRFRLVSLTDHGRAQYLRLTRTEFLLEPPGRADCQSHGEGAWLSYWHEQLASMGLQSLLELVRSDLPEQLPHLEPPYEAIRLHQRAGCLRDPFDADAVVGIDIARSAPPPRPPRLHLGLEPDPCSVRLLRRFASQRGAAATSDGAVPTRQILDVQKRWPLATDPS